MERGLCETHIYMLNLVSEIMVLANILLIFSILNFQYFSSFFFLFLLLFIYFVMQEIEVRAFMLRYIITACVCMPTPPPTKVSSALRWSFPKLSGSRGCEYG